MLFSPPSCYFLICPLVPLSTQFFDTIILTIRDIFSHPYTEYFNCAMFMVLFLYHFGMTSYSCSSCKEGNKQMSLGRG